MSEIKKTLVKKTIAKFRKQLSLLSMSWDKKSAEDRLAELHTIYKEIGEFEKQYADSLELEPDEEI